MQQSEGLLKEVKSAVDVPNQPNKKLRLAQVRLYSLHEPLLRYMCVESCMYVCMYVLTQIGLQIQDVILQSYVQGLTLTGVVIALSVAPALSGVVSQLLVFYRSRLPLIPSMYVLQSAKALSQALNEVVNCLPGQREMEEALKIVNQAMQEAEVQRREGRRRSGG